MAKIELIMPKMGESIMEATILSWNKSVGDKVETDETILEIATDKVDSDIPSPVDGVIEEILFPVDSVVEVGKVIAIIKTEGEELSSNDTIGEKVSETEPAIEKKSIPQPQEIPFIPAQTTTEQKIPARTEEKFYSPLVRNIAKTEGVSIAELNGIAGTGANGRVTKRDVLAYIEQRGNSGSNRVTTSSPVNLSANVSLKTGEKIEPQNIKTSPPQIPEFAKGEDEIIQMDRMRKLIADHMVASKRTSPHVTSFVEADVTNIVNWRNREKKSFQEQYGEKITFTPIFIEAVVKALKDFPMVNITVDGDKIIAKKDINIGMAAALPSGNLIVPVIKKADHLNIVGLTRSVNDLSNRARQNSLKPDEITDGTFTLTNVGTFGNLMGTPIINQPQVAILATGTIKKKPVVLETDTGDVIGIRSMMFLSLSYDHRVVDGFLGGSFLRRIADYLEDFDPYRKI